MSLFQQSQKRNSSSHYSYCKDPSRRVQKPVYRSIADLMKIINNHPELLNPQYRYPDDTITDLYEFENSPGSRLDYIDSLADRMVESQTPTEVVPQETVPVVEQGQPETQPETLPE